MNQVFPTLLGKELKALYSSPIAYVVIAVFLLLIPLFEWAGTFLDDGGVIGAWVDVGPGLRV